LISYFENVTMLIVCGTCWCLMSELTLSLCLETVAQLRVCLLILFDCPVTRGTWCVEWWQATTQCRI